MQEEARTKDSSEPPETYVDYCRLCELMLKMATDEHKRITVDLHGMQLQHVRQLIYLSITLATALAGVISYATKMHLDEIGRCGVLLCLAAMICSAVCFVLGIRALRGEGGTVPVVVASYQDIALMGFFPDGGYAMQTAVAEVLNSTQTAIVEHRAMMSAKGKKIRELNSYVQLTAVCAALGVLALFSTTLGDEQDEPRAAEIRTEASAATADTDNIEGSVIGAGLASVLRFREGARQEGQVS